MNRNYSPTGFYRVNYNSASWSRIINALNSDKYQIIHVLNRAALIDDLLNLARADLLDYSTALDGLRYLTRERDYLPFKAAFTALTYLDQRLSGENEYYKQFQVRQRIVRLILACKMQFLSYSQDARLVLPFANFPLDSQ